MIKTDEKSQREAREYVLNGLLIRPKIAVWQPIFLVISVNAAGIALGFVICCILKLYFNMNALQMLTTILASMTVLMCFNIKNILVLCIKCYQSRASEFVRRSCLCKPTCSEYAIIVLKKYSLIKAVRLIYIRLTKTCTGKIYKIDIP